jgi:hypothetical protein
MFGRFGYGRERTVPNLIAIITSGRWRSCGRDDPHLAAVSGVEPVPGIPDDGDELRDCQRSLNSVQENHGRAGFAQSRAVNSIDLVVLGTLLTRVAKKRQTSSDPAPRDRHRLPVARSRP